MNIFIIIQNNSLKNQLEDSRLRLESMVMSQINGVENRISNTVRSILRDNEESWVKSSEFSIVENTDEEVTLKGHFVLNGIHESTEPNIIFWPEGEIDEKQNIALINEENGQYVANMTFNSNEVYYYQISYKQDGKNFVSEPRTVYVPRYSYQQYNLDYRIYFENNIDSDFKVLQVDLTSQSGKKIKDDLNIKDAYLKVNSENDEKTVNLFPEMNEERHVNDGEAIQVVQYDNFTTRAYIKVPLVKEGDFLENQRYVYINEEDLQNTEFSLVVEYGDGYTREDEIIKNTQIWQEFVNMSE
jgi:hypothetical protein